MARGRGESTSQPTELPASIYDAACSRRPTRGWLDRRQLAPFLLALTHTLTTSFDPFGGVEETVREFGQLLAALLWRSRRTTWQSIPL